MKNAGELAMLELCYVLEMKLKIEGKLKKASVVAKLLKRQSPKRQQLIKIQMVLITVRI